MKFAALNVVAVFLLGVATPAQQVEIGEESYIRPPRAIEESVAAPWHENLNLSNQSPDGAKFLVARSGGMPPLSSLAKPYVSLGEKQIDHRANRARSLTTRSAVSYEIFHWQDGTRMTVESPAGTLVSGGAWSPSGDRVAFLVHADSGTFVHVADSATGTARRLSESPVLATEVSNLEWTSDGRSIRTVLVPEGLEAPERAAVAGEPLVRISRAGKTPSRTYRFLLETPEDMRLLEHFMTGQTALLDAEDGAITKIGEPGMTRSIDMSPSGDHFRTTTTMKPFSYFVPASQFGRREAITDRSGTELHEVSERKLNDTGRRGGPPTPPTADADKDAANAKKKEAPKRSLGWRPDAAGLAFLQLAPEPEKKEVEPAAPDTADPATVVAPDTPPVAATDPEKPAEEKKAEEKKPRKDRVMLWKAPFGESDTEVVWESDKPIASVRYSEDCRVLFVTRREEQKQIIEAVYLDEPTKSHVVFNGEAPRGGRGRRGGRTQAPPTRPTPTTGPGGARTGVRRGARGGRPTGAGNADGNRGRRMGRGRRGGRPAEETPGAKQGSLMTRTSASGVSVVRMSSDGAVYFSGNERVPEGEDRIAKAFLDKVDIKTGKVSRLYDGKGEGVESIVGVDGDDASTLIVSRQTETTVPNAFAVSVADKSERQLTQNVNYAPWVQELVVDRFKVRRVDGFEFWVKTTRHRDYGKQLPGMIWFYPREFTDQESYDRRAGSSRTRGRGRFQQPRNRSMMHLCQLGYVVIEPDMPIFGEQGRMNDNFIPDLRNGLWAVVDALDRRQIVDRDRLAVGGHSYGAFATANALAHTPFFKAGIAGDGNFNRTLTPMSFQSERRYLWDARETYFRMSPLFWANQVNGAMLMYHGAEDTNTGTFPINSERMFQALDGLGKPTSLYMYPYEAHGPAARETILDLWARWCMWLDKYVKRAERNEPSDKPAAPAIQGG